MPYIHNSDGHFLFLGVWFQDEMTGIGSEYSWIFLPGFNNGLGRCFPSQRLKVFGKFEFADEGENMRLEALQIRVIQGFDRGLLDGAVDALGLPVCPQVIRFCRFVGNTAFIANAAKDVHNQKAWMGLFRLLGKSAKAMPFSARTV